MNRMALTVLMIAAALLFIALVPIGHASMVTATLTADNHYALSAVDGIGLRLQAPPL